MTTLVARLCVLGVLLTPTGAWAQIIPESFELVLNTTAGDEQDVGGLSCPALCTFPQSFVGTQQTGDPGSGEAITLVINSGASSSSISLTGTCDGTVVTGGGATLDADFVSDGSPLLASWRWEIIQGLPQEAFHFEYRILSPLPSLEILASSPSDDFIAGSTVLNLSPGSHRIQGSVNCGLPAGVDSRSVSFEMRLEPLLPPGEPVPFLSTRGLLLLGLALLAITLLAGARNAGLSNQS